MMRLGDRKEHCVSVHEVGIPDDGHITVREPAAQNWDRAVQRIARALEFGADRDELAQIVHSAAEDPNDRFLLALAAKNLADRK